MQILLRFVIIVSIMGSFTVHASENDLSSLIIHSGEKTYLFRVEVAQTKQEQARGLMFRNSLEEDKGMLFDFTNEKPKMITMWMQNTYIPLDMIFTDSKGIIVSVHKNAQPLEKNIISSRQKASAVLEVRGGTSDRLKIKRGDRLEHRIFQY